MKRDWKIKFSILMIIAAIIIFGTNYLVLKDTHSIVSYVWLHIGFIPIDIIIVAFILEDIMSRKEKEAIYEKLDMLISTFFTEIGNELIEEFQPLIENIFLNRNSAILTGDSEGLKLFYDLNKKVGKWAYE